eukprot:394954-Rhodomonas_salina.1
MGHLTANVLVNNEGERECLMYCARGTVFNGEMLVVVARPRYNEGVLLEDEQYCCVVLATVAAAATTAPPGCCATARYCRVVVQSGTKAQY